MDKKKKAKKKYPGKIPAMVWSGIIGLVPDMPELAKRQEGLVSGSILRENAE